MLLVIVATVVLTVRLYTALPKGFLPLQDTGILIGSTLASPDVSFQAMEERQRERGGRDARRSGRGERRLHRRRISGWSSLNRGQPHVSLKPLSERKFRPRR